MNEENKKDILTRKQAAALLGICLTTLDRLDIPKTKIGKRVVYMRELVNQWLDEHTEKSKGGNT